MHMLVSKVLVKMLLSSCATVLSSSCAAALSWNAPLHHGLSVSLLLAWHTLSFLYCIADIMWLAPQHLLSLLGMHDTYAGVMAESCI